MSVLVSFASRLSIDRASPMGGCAKHGCLCKRVIFDPEEGAMDEWTLHSATIIAIHTRLLWVIVVV